jgi:hypothetical protein
MNNPAINSYDDLCAEKARLKALLSDQRLMIKAEIAGIKEDLKPVGVLLDTAGMLAHRDRSLGLLSKGLDIGVEFLVKKVVFRKAGWITKLLASFVAKNIVSQIATKKVKEELPGLSKIVAQDPS